MCRSANQDVADLSQTHPKQAKVIFKSWLLEVLRRTAEAPQRNLIRFAQNQLPDQTEVASIRSDCRGQAGAMPSCSNRRMKRVIKQGGRGLTTSKLTTLIRSEPQEGMVVQVGKRKFAKLKVK